MKIDVLLFAAARQHAGAETIAITLPDPATVADLRHSIGQQCPALRAWIGQMMIALDQQYAGDQAVIDPRMEVACFPPVSGG